VFGVIVLPGPDGRCVDAAGGISGDYCWEDFYFSAWLRKREREKERRLEGAARQRKAASEQTHGKF
jgi:hypothetical protein